MKDSSYGRKKSIEIFKDLIRLSFASIKENGYALTRKKICQMLTDLYVKYSYIKDSDALTDTDKNFLDTHQYGTYWANTSSNSLVSKLIREGASEIKQSMEQLLKGEHFICPIDEQIVYNQLDDNEEAIWSLLVASGYLKILSYEQIEKVQRRPNYELALTNGEVRLMFEEMISGWFGRERGNYNCFIKAMLAGDIEEMNAFTMVLF